MNPISPGLEAAAGGTTAASTDKLIRPRQNFEVIARVQEDRRYTVDARTAEEAEAVVEGVYTDHDYSYELLDSTISDILEVYPAE